MTDRIFIKKKILLTKDLADKYLIKILEPLLVYLWFKVVFWLSTGQIKYSINRQHIQPISAYSFE